MIGKGVVLVIADDDVIKKCNAENFPGIGKAIRQTTVCWAGCGIATGVVVSECNRGCVEQDGAFKDFSWADMGFIQPAHRDVVNANDGVLCVEKDAIDLFTILMGQERGETFDDIPRVAKMGNTGAQRGRFLNQTDRIARETVWGERGHDRTP